MLKVSCSTLRRAPEHELTARGRGDPQEAARGTASQGRRAQEENGLLFHAKAVGAVRPTRASCPVFRVVGDAPNTRCL